MTDKKTETNKEQELTSSKDDFEVYRMWSAISFSVMLIIIGIPLWWKTTEVYRASLPYNEIDALDPSRVKIKTNVLIYSKYPNRVNTIIDDLKSCFNNLTIYDVDIKPFKLDIEPITYEMIEKTATIHPNAAGTVLLIEVLSLPQNVKIFVSNHRIAYFTSQAETSSIGKILLDWFFEEEALIAKVTSILTPQKVSNDEDKTSRLRASPRYDVIFTVINSDPENLNFHWDVKSEVTGHMKPLLTQLSKVSRHHIKSQWLYLMDLGEIPHKDQHSEGYFYKFSQLPHIITPLEKKLGSGISKNPCVHMILYLASCSQRPLCFMSEKESGGVEGMISPQWGAVQILNPTAENCENHTQIQFSSKHIMSFFITQFHALLGVKNKVGGNGMVVGEADGPTLHTWELDSLFRIRTVEQIVSASLTLQSLSKLLGEISNIVINEEVGGYITSAVEKVKEAGEMLRSGQLAEAMETSQEAHIAAETAFSDPSLLSLLYFPDDQKYAVYIPLFLPIMIPVIMSLKRIFVWMTKGPS